MDTFLSTKALLAVVAVAGSVLLLLRKGSRQRATAAAHGVVGSPPTRPSWLPYGLDRLFLAMRAHKQNRGLELWSSMFRDWANPRRPLTFQSCLGGQNVIFTIDPENLKAVLARQFDAFGKGSRFDHLRPFLGDSIFINDGDKWSSARELLRPHLSEDRISDMRILEGNVDALLACIQDQQAKAGRVPDVEDLFLRYTMDVITEFLLGTNPHSLQDAHTTFAAAFHDIQVFSGQIARAGSLSFLVPQKRYREALAILDGYIEPYVRRAIALAKSADGASSEPTSGETSTRDQSFLHTLAQTKQDPQFLRDSIVTVLFAGRDSTASTLTWLLHEMSRHPEHWRRLRAEVLAVVGPEGTKPTFQDLKKMVFVQACINETLRLYPLVPFNIREALVDTTLPRGGGPDGMDPIRVPKKTAISFSPLYLQRNMATYSYVLAKDPSWPDPMVFDPSRWATWTPKAWTHLPFNGGPRLCLGQRFAMTEMAYSVSRLAQRFAEITDAGDGKEPGLMCNLTVSPATKIQVKFELGGGGGIYEKKWLFTKCSRSLGPDSIA